MNLRDLHYLIALADHRHFGQAAEACHISQPTLSTQIRKLEEELGVALVERAPRRVMLTDAGKEIVSRARHVLAEVAQMREVARRTRDPEAGSLRLGLFPTLGPYLLPHVMPSLRQRYPRLELLLVEEKTETLLNMLRSGRIDAACLALPIHDAQLQSELLFEEPFVLAVPASHHFADMRALRMDDLHDEHLLLLEDGHCLRDQALDVCALSGAGERDDFRATSLETLRQMVVAGVGITLLPNLAVSPPVPVSEGIRLIPFQGRQPPSRRIALVWRRSSAMREFLSGLARLLQEAAERSLAMPTHGAITGEAKIKSVSKRRRR